LPGTANIEKVRVVLCGKMDGFCRMSAQQQSQGHEDAVAGVKPHTL
jgi:hypothetical protein